MLTSAGPGRAPFQNPLSVRDVLVRDDLLRRYPHQQLTLNRVAPAVLIGPVGAHVAALPRALSGREDWRIPLRVEPDRCCMGPAVRAHGGENCRPSPPVEHE